MKRLFLELGGKSAAIVLDDADLAARLMLAFGVCMHAGQGCATPTRMLLPRSRYDEGVEMREGHASRRSSPATRRPTTPCAARSSRPGSATAIVGYIRTGIEEGANLVVGGPDAPAGLDTGYFVTPTLFVDVDNSMTIAREEIFGPVLVVIPYEDDDDAVRIANDSPYGLAGFVLSESLDRSTGRRAPPPGRHHRPERRRGHRRRRALRRLQGQRRRSPERLRRLRPVPRGEVRRVAGRLSSGVASSRERIAIVTVPSLDARQTSEPRTKIVITILSGGSWNGTGHHARHAVRTDRARLRTGASLRP